MKAGIKKKLISLIVVILHIFSMIILYIPQGVYGLDVTAITTIIVGDSITKGWSGKGYFKNNQIIGRDSAALSTSVQAYWKDLTDVYYNDTVNNTYESAIKKANPQNILLAFGMNDTSSNNFIFDYKELVTTVRGLLPNANIYIVSITPCTKNNAYGVDIKNIEARNNELKNWVGTDGNLQYIDVYTSMLGEDGYLPNNYSNSGDGIHPNKAGYAVYYKVLQEMQGVNNTIATITNGKWVSSNTVYDYVDISKHNGDVNFQTMKSQGIDGVVLRGAYGTKKDIKLDTYYSDAIEVYGTVGIYIFTTSHYRENCGGSLSKAKEEADKEIQQLDSFLTGKNISIVALDLECESNHSVGLNQSDLTEYSNYYCGKLESLGYQTMIYTSVSWLTSYIDYNLVQYNVWAAYYSGCSVELNTDSITFPSNKYGQVLEGLKNAGRLWGWQYSADTNNWGSKLGVSTSDIDLDYVFMERTVGGTSSDNTTVNTISDIYIDDEEVIIPTIKFNMVKLSNSDKVRLKKLNAELNATGKLKLLAISNTLTQCIGIVIILYLLVEFIAWLLDYGLGTHFYNIVTFKRRELKSEDMELGVQEYDIKYVSLKRIIIQTILGIFVGSLFINSESILGILIYVYIQ